VADVEKVAARNLGLDLVFHPHVATYVRRRRSANGFIDATSHAKIRTLPGQRGHCVYGTEDSVKEAEKYKDKAAVRAIIKDCNSEVLEEARSGTGLLRGRLRTRCQP